MNSFESQPIKIAVAGGGEGTSVMAEGLTDALALQGINAEVTSIVTVFDEGGSTEKIRRVTGYPAMGDAGKNLGAFCRDPDARSVFDTRYGEQNDGSILTIDDMRRDCARFISTLSLSNPSFNHERTAEILDETESFARELGSVDGHTFRNLFLTAAITKNSGMIDAATLETGHILGNRGRVIPISNDSAHLVMYDGERVDSEGNIDVRNIRNPSSAQIWLEPDAHITKVAKDAIVKSDILFSGPGSMFTSRLPHWLVIGSDIALNNMTGQFVDLGNLEIQSRETRGWKFSDYLLKNLQYTHGREFDWLICHDSEDPLPDNAQPVVIDMKRIEELGHDGRVIRADLLDRNTQNETSAKSDRLAATRSKLRTSPEAVAEVISTRILPVRVVERELELVVV